MTFPLVFDFTQRLTTRWVKIKGRENVDLEVPPHEVHRDLADRAGFADASVVDQNVEIKAGCVRHIVRIENVELRDR